MARNAITLGLKVVQASTGLERLDWHLYIPKSPLFSSTPLASSEPILKINKKDSLTIAIEGVEDVAAFPARLCTSENLEKRNRARDQVLFAMLGRFDLQACMEVESNIDLVNPRRSSLWKMRNATRQTARDVDEWISQP